MNRNSIAIFGVLTGLFSVAAHAAPGEYWEITNKMEMPGMPFAMPATTTKVCIAKGGEKDPQKTTGDKDCKVTDVKTVGNKVSWKARCDHNGEVMTGTGEQTTSANGYEGKMKFTGTSHGNDMNMAMTFSGKRLGGSCDSDEAIKKMRAQICDTSRYHSTAEWISGSDLILQPGSACSDQRKQLCETVRKDTPNDVQAYNALLLHDQQTGGNISIVKECQLNMTTTTRSICKKLNGDTYSQLSATCPAEAKTYRVAQRKLECEGRSYTAETRAADIKKCLGGKDEATDNNDSEKSSAKQKSGNPAADLLESASKLRSKFGF